MPKSPLQKALQEYISKLKKTPSLQFRIRSKSLSVSTKRFIKSCKHPRTHSFSLENTRRSPTQNTNYQNDEAATLEDVDRFLFENFKQLYMNDREVENDESTCKFPNEPSRRFINPPPDVCGFRHFFDPLEPTTSDDVASYSSTASTDASFVSIAVGTSILGDESRKVMGPDDYITLLTYSPSPYDDFKQSMQDMVDARLHHHGKVDWEFMDELLSCYMDLNDKRSYKYILSAFVDLVVTLREDSTSYKVPPIAKWANHEEKLKRITSHKQEGGR